MTVGEEARTRHRPGGTRRMELGRAVACPPPGQYFIPYAYRSNLTGFVRSPITALWNVRRT